MAFCANQILGTVTNGQSQPRSGKLFREPDILLRESYRRKLFSDRPTQLVVFGFNDNGFGDDNHDDFVGVMALVPALNCQCEITPTPLPATLPLFATGLGASGLLGWRRKKKAIATA